jgi:hypothetical protein
MAAEKPDIMAVENSQLDEENAKQPIVCEIDNIRVLGLTEEDAEFYQDFGEERRAKLVRKVCAQLGHFIFLAVTWQAAMEAHSADVADSLSLD